MSGKYIDVVVGTIYLKKFFLSVGVTIDNLDLTEFEVDYAETWAENRIDSRLGVMFGPTPGDTPLLIRDIALALTAVKCRQFMLTANAPNLDDHVENLKKEAEDTIEDLLHGRRTLWLTDGTVHPEFQGPSDGVRFAEQQESALRLFFINMDRTFFEMEQEREPDGIEEEFHDGIYHSNEVNDPLNHKCC